ncbi:hypothetical protein H7J77_17135 [Mycolicibacillus parakoreensis]|uniref:Uncharacterized protein n=1 Tax=Mycolicibacillus parakoreensis TaxID=1069221 RepID=A0ABY3TWD9_9MYCO|nr:hypothetical protein [Mycolicibacillus parakoreensis]MCV7317261.1 hypothetical protein [Mycolicibacillus parakoreensis]ULN51527.1 hypothetical protein MIU77_11475 [Mycolicibacillus parakoreensis]
MKAMKKIIATIAALIAALTLGAGVARAERRRGGSRGGGSATAFLLPNLVIAASETG